MKSEIDNINALEILDSRGNPTIKVEVTLMSGARGFASVPSGASTGSREALEMRDGDPSRYNGKGVLKAIDIIEKLIYPAVRGRNAFNQSYLDQCMIDLDGTEYKSKLGANSILAVSLAIAKAAASQAKLPFYAYIREYLYESPAYTLPVPMMNIINGGEHADNNLDIQEFMIQPFGFSSFKDALRCGAEIFHILKSDLLQLGLNTSVGDEGGFAPDLESNDMAIELICQSIIKAGYCPGENVNIALDCAATEFYRDGRYHLNGEGTSYNSMEFIGYLNSLATKHPISSIEDGLFEDDWTGWASLTKKLGRKVQLVGDDLFVTNPKYLRHGIEHDSANAILIKPNQIGTVTETLDAIKIAQDANFKVVVSHRSGETEDTSIADIAVGTGAGQIKTGSLSRSDRIAKYNRLLEIEAQLSPDASFGLI